VAVTDPIDVVGVVVPARDEERLLPACLEAIEGALAALDGVQTYVVVALDSCADGSAAVVASFPWAHAVVTDAGNVGSARGRGVSRVLEQVTDTPAERIWLATTDADSVVPPDWLTGQLALARSGWEVVVGTVVVDDWTGHPADTAPRWLASYHPVEHHPHVHGANLGCSAAAYLDAGGWSPLASDEDVALLAALAHRRVIRTATLPVVTSSRLDPRAAGGFGDALRDLAG
jgi:glycosyltransferase involved in cell wall biosynthesis